MFSQAIRATRNSARVGPSLRAAQFQRSFHASRIARDHFLQADEDAFNKRVLDQTNSKPVLVDFFAEWCQPCRVLTPALKKQTGPETDYDLMTIDVDQFPDLASKYKVSALPTVVAFKEGQVKNKFVGFRNEGDIKKFLGML
ncbi:thioredoxin [Kwoniella sp. DSM 27419]